MAIALVQLVNPSGSRWYHCITRCVRREHLLGEGLTDRKQWLEDGLRELAGIFSLPVAGYVVMENHLHVLVRLDPDGEPGWLDEEIVRRWGRLFPPRGGIGRLCRSRRRGLRRSWPMPAGWPRPGSGW